ncbi:hypothetical protein Barb7_00413 [Bacteroidales bacterium Barb7]|nr:hypothetical protein Barb7_00413 [Bacteroidales bacterium Barb7]
MKNEISQRNEVIILVFLLLIFSVYIVYLHKQLYEW